MTVTWTTGWLAGVTALALVGTAFGAFATRPAAFGQYLGACRTDDDCPPTDTCQSFRRLGLRCTRPCERDLDCPRPSKGCSQQSRCSMPAWMSPEAASDPD